MFVHTENKIYVSGFSGETVSKLPIGTWLMKFDELSGFYLERQEDFKLPKKLYGKVKSLSDRFLTHYKNKEKNLGVWLDGLKGTGKSLLAKQICIDSNMPIVLITTGFTGADFEAFLAKLGECVVMIDEFEKVYSNSSRDGKSSQDALLTILDGVFESKKLFILTSNNSHKVSDAFLNRPSRIHYKLTYSGLSNDVIEEVIDDLLINKVYKESLMDLTSELGDVNMDMLVSILTEINLFNEPPSEVISLLNIERGVTEYVIKSSNIEFIKRVIKDQGFEDDNRVKDLLKSSKEISLSTRPFDVQGEINFENISESEIKASFLDDKGIPKMTFWLYLGNYNDFETIRTGKGAYEFKSPEGFKFSLERVEKTPLLSLIY